MPPAATAFEPSRELSLPAPAGYEAAGFPTLALDGIGTLYVTWERFAPKSEAPRGLGFVASADGAAHFSTPVVVPRSIDPYGINGSLQGRLMQKLAVNDTGTVAVANRAFAEGRGSPVWLLRGRTP